MSEATTIDPDEAQRQAARLAELRERLAPVKAYVESVPLADRPTLKVVARRARLTMFHFHRLFREAFGTSAKEIFTARQIEAAKGLLLRGVAPPAVADICGFAHQSHFTSRFSQFVGQSPMRWLQAQRAAAAPTTS